MQTSVNYLLDFENKQKSRLSTQKLLLIQLFPFLSVCVSSEQANRQAGKQASK